MNILSEYCAYIQCEFDLQEAVKIWGKEKGSELHKRYAKAQNPFLWYLTLTMDESDTLYFYLLRKFGERKERRSS